jgi:hypothetical protein
MSSPPCSFTFSKRRCSLASAQCHAGQRRRWRLERGRARARARHCWRFFRARCRQLSSLHPVSLADGPVAARRVLLVICGLAVFGIDPLPQLLRCAVTNSPLTFAEGDGDDEGDDGEDARLEGEDDGAYRLRRLLARNGLGSGAAGRGDGERVGRREGGRVFRHAADGQGRARLQGAPAPQRDCMPRLPTRTARSRCRLSRGIRCARSSTRTACDAPRSPQQSTSRQQQQQQQSSSQ